MPRNTRRQYAEDTRVPVENSRAEIEKLVKCRGATGFGYADMGTVAAVVFRMEPRVYRMEIPIPKEDDFLTDTRGALRTSAGRRTALEQVLRQRWRALALIVKAKLTAIDAGISTFEKEFLADVVLPDGQRFGEWAQPQLQRSYENAGMPPLLASRS